jgi:hypothetical protein
MPSSIPPTNTSTSPSSDGWYGGLRSLLPVDAVAPVDDDDDDDDDGVDAPLVVDVDEVDDDDGVVVVGGVGFGVAAAVEAAEAVPAAAAGVPAYGSRRCGTLLDKIGCVLLICCSQSFCISHTDRPQPNNKTIHFLVCRYVLCHLRLSYVSLTPF